MLACSQCPATSEKDRLPPGWKRHKDQVWCADCWNAAYVQRPVTIPIAGPVDGEWPELRATLKNCWAAATAIANWAVTEMARNDTPRTMGQERLSTATKLYLYPGARLVSPECDPQSVTAVLHAVESRYRKSRLAVMWFRNQALPLYRYPVPYPVHNQSWSTATDDQGRPCISVRLGGRRWLLRLQAGHEFRRQLASWRLIHEGEVLHGELSLLCRESSANRHGNGLEMREPGGGPRQPMVVLAKMMAWLPRKAAGPAQGVLYVRTSSPEFLVYHVGERGEPKYLHAEHVRRWEAQHRRHLRGIADDTKHEKRVPKQMKIDMLARQDAWVRKYRDRIDTFIHQTTAMLAGFARRQGVATVDLDVTNKAFCERFPWYKFKETLKYKLEEIGISLEIRDRSSEDEDSATVREGVN